MSSHLKRLLLGNSHPGYHALVLVIEVLIGALVVLIALRVGAL
jgi:hypothetical protein